MWGAIQGHHTVHGTYVQREASKTLDVLDCRGTRLCFFTPQLTQCFAELQAHGEGSNRNSDRELPRIFS